MFAFLIDRDCKTLRAKWLPALLLACFLLMAGCVNLDDVAQFTKLAENARQTLPAVVADIPASCERHNKLFEEIPDAERPPNSAAQDCKAYRDLADHLNKDQNVLIEYFDSLGKLASNLPLSYEANIDTNVQTISQMPGLSQGAITASTAAQKIAKVLADAVTKSYREHKVNSIIASTDEAVQELTKALKEVVVDDYAGSQGGILSSEAQIMDTYYQSPMAAAGKSERLALILVQRQYDGDKLALQSRKDAAQAYGQVMTNLASLHSKLKAEAAKKASLRDIGQQIGPEVANLKDAISQLRTKAK